MKTVTYITSRIPCPFNGYELDQIAKTIMILLQISGGSDVSLLLGHSADRPNQSAIALWVKGYIESHPNQQDFKDDVYPAFIRHLNRCQQDLMAEAELLQARY
jgi:hypothetical protein